MDTDDQGKENMHVMQVPTSPSFLKPKPIKLRKRVNRPKTILPLNEVDPNKDSNDSGLFLLKSPVTVRNPFKRNENKRKREPETIDDNSNSFLWKQVNRVYEQSFDEVKILPSPVIPSMLDECALSSFSDTISSGVNGIEEKASENKTKTLPVDWSLKTKIRFTSPLPFPNRGSFRTFEEVNGTIGFVRCLHSGKSDNKSSDVHSSHGAKFFQQCLVWMHPSLPWLNLFPRMERRIGKQSGYSLDSSALEILHSKWCDSFRSLYQLVRLYQCPYFYMCTHRFTVLFRCAGAASIPVLHAFISPTTKGFRRALREEGITFTMPLFQGKDSELSADETLDEDMSITNDENESEQEDDPVEDDETGWLESIGLSQDVLNQKKRRSEMSYKIDHKPESLVYVEDCETQALVNFLLNSHLCTSKVGPLAGIPPTLLAPTAFLGGTLQSLQIRHGRVKQGNEEMNSMEINGPLLPNAIHSLCSLFGHTQDGNFQSILTTHAPTSAFSMLQPQSPLMPCIFAQNNMDDCGLPLTFVQQMCSRPLESPVNTINMEDGLFSSK